MVLPSNIAAVLGGAWSLINQTHTYLNGTLRPLGALGAHPVGLLVYHPSGYMSANIWSTDPGAIPAPADSYTASEYALIGNHTLSYAGGLQLWPDSNETVGTVTHGPLVMSTRPAWVVENQTRNYVVTKKGYEGKDVLRLWLRVDDDDAVANLFWARAGGGNASVW